MVPSVLVSGEGFTDLPMTLSDRNKAGQKKISALISSKKLPALVQTSRTGNKEIN